MAFYSTFVGFQKETIQWQPRLILGQNKIINSLMIVDINVDHFTNDVSSSILSNVVYLESSIELMLSYNAVLANLLDQHAT